MIISVGYINNIDFYKKEYDYSGWEKIAVPGLWELNGYGKPQYLAYSYPESLGVRKGQIPSIKKNDNPTGSYIQTFKIDKTWLVGKTILHFGAVKSAFYLWVNGQYVGYSQGSMTPAEFDISPYIIQGENSFAVEVYKYSDGTYLEDQDMWFFAGIYRSISNCCNPLTRFSASSPINLDNSVWYKSICEFACW